MQEKVWLQPIVQFLSVRGLWKPRSLRFIMNTWVGRGKIREDARHTHCFTRCEYVALTQRLGVSCCVYRMLRRW